MEQTVLDIEYKMAAPPVALAHYVERFYSVTNPSTIDKEMVVIPDGRIDLFFIVSDKEPLTCLLLGLETKPSTIVFSAQTKILGISYKLSAVDVILHHDIANILNSAKKLPSNLWDIRIQDLSSFEEFCAFVSDKLFSSLKGTTDARKQKLFELMYATNGSLTVKEYSERAAWSSRQINRYFNKTFGLSLKAYCNLLRFKASFPQIKEGNFSPEQNFSDQAHFTREVKKLAGVVPKELLKNKNDRFIQFSSLPKD